MDFDTKNKNILLHRRRRRRRRRGGDFKVLPDCAGRHPEGLVLLEFNLGGDLRAHQHQVGAGVNRVWNIVDA